MTASRRFLITAAAVAAVLIAVPAGLYFCDPVFWDRYFHAYTFESFVENPFPTRARLYPQERVAGTSQPGAPRLPRPGQQAISAAALESAVRFAERTESTALLVSHDGVLQLERYWKGAGPETPLYSFSMHKSVVALLVGLAIEDGAIGGVDDAVARYLPAWSTDERKGITIRHLLHMNSGLEPMEFPVNPFSRHVQRQIGTDLAATALEFPLAGEPGAAFSYNGVNPTLLVMVLEAATGRRYADYLSERLWKPLGNRDAAVWLDREGGLARGATSLFATGRDWLRLGEMLLNDGMAGDANIVPSAWINEMLTPSPTNPQYGYLVWLGTKHEEKRTLESFEGFAAVAEDPFAAGDIFFFDGLGGQRVYVIPSKRLVIVRTGVLARTWEDTYLPNILAQGVTQ